MILFPRNIPYSNFSSKIFDGNLLKEDFDGVVGKYLGPLVNKESCLCAQEKDERLRSLADGNGVVAGRAGCGSFFGSGSSGC